MGANKQIGWSQESILLHGVSKQLERLAGLVATFGGGGGGGGGAVAGSLRTLDSLSLDGTLKIISDTTGVQSALRLSTTSVTNYGGGGIESNTAYGEDALLSNVDGFSNTAIGGGALGDNLSGDYNVAIGGGALNFNTYGTQNMAIGAFALYSNIGIVNSDSIEGHRSVAIGTSALQNNTTGNGIAIGNFALYNQTTGVNNIAIGLNAGGGVTGNNNVILATTGYATVGGGITSGNNNMILAPNLGNTTGLTTGSGNVIVGKTSGLAAALTNTVIISDGVNNQRFISDSTFLSRLPLQTSALITGGDGKSILIKEYLATVGVTINGSLIPIGGSASFTTPAQTTTLISLAVPFSSTVTTRATVTGWTFAVTAGKRYKVEISALYQSAVTTTGGSIGVILSSGTGTIQGMLGGEIAITTVATGLRTTISAINNVNTTANSFMTTTGVGVINTPHFIGGAMLFTCVTTGVFEVQWASEVAASASQLNTGSALLVTEY